MSAYLASQAHPQLDPLLAQNKPQWMDDIKLTKCAAVACLLSSSSLVPELEQGGAITARACIPRVAHLW